MAQKIEVAIIDDLDGESVADCPGVQFGLDGVTYEIDLTQDNAERLRETLADYVTAARRTGGRRQRSSRVTAQISTNGHQAKLDPKKVRAWALAQGIELSPRGRIPAHVEQQYLNEA